MRWGNSPFTSWRLPSPKSMVKMHAPRPVTLIATGCRTTPGLGVKPTPVISFGAAGGGGGAWPVTSIRVETWPSQFPIPRATIAYEPGFW
jgi:hypothetical protein